MSFAVPLLLAGVVLVGVPWLIHRIRRPERQEVRFSSLMFVPQVKKEVIERRKLEHLLLMLLRMLLVLLMVAAFSRPFQSREDSGEIVEPAAAYHLILLDRSASMGIDGRMNRARDRAAEILRDLPLDSAADVVVFDRDFTSLSDGLLTERSNLFTALNTVTSGMGRANLRGAMQYAERRLLTAAQQVERAELTLHLISDFQKQSRNDSESWKLSGQIQFRAEPVSSPWPANIAVEDLSVRIERDERLIVAAKVKNWDREPKNQVPVRLVIADEVFGEELLDLGPWSGAQVRFEVPASEGGVWQGFVTVEDDGPDFDDRRYFVKPVPRPTEIRLIRPESDSAVRGGAWFLERALRSVGDQRWRLQTLTPQELSRLDVEVAEVVIVYDVSRLSDNESTLLAEFVASGGGLFVLFGKRADSNAWQPFLSELNIQLGTAALAQSTENIFAVPIRVDLAHPLYRAFQGPQFNDFSTLRFQNYRRLSLNDEQQAVAFLAPRGQSAEDVLTASSNFQQGRWVIWPFTPDLAWTNLAKHVKFLPMVHETIGFLAPPATPDLFLTTSESPDLRARTSTWSGTFSVVLPEGESHQVDRDGLAMLRPEQSGFLELRNQRGQTITAAVNHPAEESETAVQQPNEVALQWTTTGSVAEGNERAVVENATTSIEMKRDEFGWLFIPALALLILVETIAAIAFSRQPKRKLA